MHYHTAGRYLRIALGTILVAYGWYHARTDIGIAALIVGLLAAAAGLLDFGVAPLGKGRPHAGH